MTRTANARESAAVGQAVAGTRGMEVATIRGTAVAVDQAAEALGQEAGRNTTVPGEDPVAAAPTKAEGPTAMVEDRPAEATTKSTMVAATPARQTRTTRAMTPWPLMKKAKHPERQKRRKERTTVDAAGRHTALHLLGVRPRHVGVAQACQTQGLDMLQHVGVAQACQTQELDMAVLHRVAWTRHLLWRGSNMPVSAAVDQLVPTQAAART